jgi:hypothetical protein
MLLHDTNTQLFDKLEKYVVGFIICSSVMMMYNGVLLRCFHCKTNQLFLLLNILLDKHNNIVIVEKKEEKEKKEEEKDILL